jgi:predicted ATP-grasp superfamily ATP-dependent carboligase
MDKELEDYNNEKLDELLQKAKARVDAMTPKQLREMLREQAESWARSIINWPKPKYHYENGVKVYHSYEDYCND